MKRRYPVIDNLYALSELFHLPVDAMLIGNRKNECKCQDDICQRVLLYYERMTELKVG